MIRDILHRIEERWPCRVIVWPVVVQGESACGQVSAAIQGFELSLIHISEPTRPY